MGEVLLIGNDIPAKQGIKVWLSSQFSINNLGKASYILGMRIYWIDQRKLLGVSQSKYVDTVLKSLA